MAIETGSPVRAAVIWLHGLGADGHDFEPVVPQLGARLPVPTRFIFPHAPFRPVTINNGYVMRAWYDMAVSDVGYRQDESHINDSAASVRRMIDNQQRLGIEASRVVVAGFSQGGVVALVAGLTYGKRLGGIIVLSAPVPDATGICQRANPVQSGLEIFLAHGSKDPVAPIAFGRAAQATLSRSGYRVNWKEYPIEHTVNADELTAISDYLATALV